MNVLARATAALLLAGAATSASAVTINFDDGVPGAQIGNFYAGLGVTFTNTVFSANFGLAGTTGALGITPGAYEFTLGNAMVGTFSAPQNFVSIRGIDVGNQGARIDALDASKP